MSFAGLAQFRGVYTKLLLKTNLIPVALLSMLTVRNTFTCLDNGGNKIWARCQIVTSLIVWGTKHSPCLFSSVVVKILICTAHIAACSKVWITIVRII